MSQYRLNFSIREKKCKVPSMFGLLPCYLFSLHTSNRYDNFFFLRLVGCLSMCCRKILLEGFGTSICSSIIPGQARINSLAIMLDIPRRHHNIHTTSFSQLIQKQKFRQSRLYLDCIFSEFFVEKLLQRSAICEIKKMIKKYVHEKRSIFFFFFFKICNLSFYPNLSFPTGKKNL